MAWQYVTHVEGVEVLSGNVTAVDGGVQGDLMVCGVAARGNAAFTLPAGWALVGTAQNSGNVTVNTTASISSGLLAYIVRGASPPALVFTRTAGDAARATTSVFRGQKATSPLDAASATTLAVASTAVITPTLTTAEHDELLVAFYSGARAGAGTDFDAATGATIGSGAVSDSVTHPQDNTWLRRRSVTSTGGADYALAIADAVM